VAEEVRFFLRTALYAAVIAVVYWFASREYEGIVLGYDWAGTTLLAFTVLACGAIPGAVLLLVRTARQGWTMGNGPLPRRIRVALNRLIGFGEVAGRTEAPLAGGPDLLPAESPWPIVSAVAGTLILLGLVYGAWLIVPGVVLLAIGAGGWLRRQ
jgi:hypothetical protein